VSDPDQRELYLSLGCALENLLVAAEHFGFAHGVSYFPRRWQPDLVATVLFHSGGTISPARAGATLDALRLRHNDPSVFSPAPIPESVQRTLKVCCDESDLALDLTDDPRLRNWFEALTVASDTIDFANPAFRMELAYWIRQAASGVPGQSHGAALPEAGSSSLGGTIAQNYSKVESAAMLGLIRSAGDSHLTHLRAGQLFERVWVTATAAGLSMNPMSQTMRRPELRSTVATLLPMPGWVPQHVFRIGYSTSHPRQYTARRSVDDVLR
jgi:hypothetical protein